jgi:hypothetical protein
VRRSELGVANRAIADPSCRATRCRESHHDAQQPSDGGAGRIVPSLIICLCLLAGTPSTSFAADDPEKLVAQLADVDFVVREMAQRKLRELGAAAKDAIEKAITSKDAEQRLRVESLLRELRRDELWTAPKLTFEPGEREVKAAFLELSKRSGNPFNWDRSSHSFNGSVAFTDKPTTYWEALDDLCRQSNTAVHFYDDPNGRGPTLTRGPPGLYPTAYVGPVRFRLQSIRQALQKEIHFGEAEPDVTDNWSVAVQMHWEQRAGLCRYRGRPTILELRTDAGEDLKPIRPERQKDVMMPIIRRQRELSFTLSHQPPTKPATKFTLMRFEIDLVLAGDFATLELPIDQTGGVVETDGYRMQLDRYRKEGLATSFQVRITRAEALDTSMNSPDLVDERLILVSDGKPVEFSVQQTLGARTQVQYQIRTEQPLAADAKIQLRAPTLRSPRKVEFSFKDVRLP